MIEFLFAIFFVGEPGTSAPPSSSRNCDEDGEGLIWPAEASGIPVTYLQNVAMARKQNFAGVVNGKRMGRMCAVSS